MRFDQLIGYKWTDSNHISVNINPSNTIDIIGEFARGALMMWISLLLMSESHNQHGEK